MAQQRLVPVNGRIVVRREKEQERSKGGIIVPDTAKEKPARGEVLEVSAPWMNERGFVQTSVFTRGETVLLGRYAGTEVEHEGETYVLVEQSDIIAKLAAVPTEEPGF